MNGAYDRLPALRLRVEKEFRELPGLHLTRWQAARLWNLPADECDQLLDRLVIARVLRRTGDGFAAGELCQRPFVQQHSSGSTSGQAVSYFG